MAQAIPCAICNEVGEADFLVTMRPEGLLGQAPATFGVCAGCFVGIARVVEAQISPTEPEPDEDSDEDEMDAFVSSIPGYLDHQPPAVDEPGVLAAIEADEGAVPVPAERVAARKRSKASGNGDRPAAVEQAETADVDS